MIRELKEIFALERRRKLPFWKQWRLLEQEELEADKMIAKVAGHDSRNFVPLTKCMSRNE